MISEKYKEYSLLSILNFQEFQKLGDFVVTLARFNLHIKATESFLTYELIKETENEIQTFLRMLLQEITSEKDLSWSLIDAVDILVILGKKMKIHVKMFNQ